MFREYRKYMMRSLLERFSKIFHNCGEGGRPEIARAQQTCDFKDNAKYNKKTLLSGGAVG